MSRNKSWKTNAMVFLDDYELGKYDFKLTQSILAETLGVSRQTIWRDQEIVERFKKISKISPGSNSKGRKNPEMQIRALRKQVEELTLQNNKLIQVIVSTAVSLREASIDPRSHIPDPNPEPASKLNGALSTLSQNA